MLRSHALRFPGLLPAVLAAAMLLAAGPARASADDYRFETVGNPSRSGDATLIRLRLVHLPDQAPVAGAILIQPKLEMGTGRDAMTAPASVAAAPEPALYAIAARPSMAGEWALSLAAKVPGEAATIRGRVVVNLAQ